VFVSICRRNRKTISTPLQTGFETVGPAYLVRASWHAPWWSGCVLHATVLPQSPYLPSTQPWHHAAIVSIMALCFLICNPVKTHWQSMLAAFSRGGEAWISAFAAHLYGKAVHLQIGILWMFVTLCTYICMMHTYIYMYEFEKIEIPRDLWQTFAQASTWPFARVQPPSSVSTPFQPSDPVEFDNLAGVRIKYLGGGLFLFFHKVYGITTWNCELGVFRFQCFLILLLRLILNKHSYTLEYRI